MISQPEHIGYHSQEEDHDNREPYYHKLKQTQEAVTTIYPNFPLQLN